MFADSMLETSWAQCTRRSWTTLTSFGLQVLIVALLLLLPLWKKIGLPAARVVSTPISLGRVAVETAPAPRSGRPSVPQANMLPVRFLQPGHIPTVIRMRDDGSSAPPQGGGEPGDGEPGLFPGTGTGPNLGFLPGGTRPLLPTPPPSISRAFRTSSMMEGMLIRKVQPVYPPLAKSAHVQGSVLVYALINKAGTMENVHAISGHPMLVPAAIDAVSQWRYRPYILNNEPVEVETRITVNFYLAGN
jgi:periplasmic protein TonB